MKKGKPLPPDQRTLRQQAEDHLANEGVRDGHPPADEDSRRLVHELQVHQIELEVQNEELRQARLGLEASRERYVDLYDFAPVGYFTVDQRWIIREANLAGAALLGAKRSAVLGRNLGGFISRGTRQAFHDLLVGIAAKQTKQVCEVQLEGSGEAPRFLHLEGVAVAPGQDQEGGFRLAVVDITERKRGEEALQVLAAIVESSDDGIIGMALDGVITSWNRGAQAIYGYSAQEMVGGSESVLAPPEHSGEMHRILAEVRQGRRVGHFETERIAKDGRTLSISLTVSPTRNFRDEITGASIISRDITPRIQAEKERNELLHQYQEALAKVKLLSGLLPICSNCKKIRDDQGYWQRIEKFVQDHTKAQFTHGICPDCAKLLYPDLVD
ncbi:MAG: PAS domain S-box protein [Pseudomonadota bacterium]